MGRRQVALSLLSLAFVTGARADEPAPAAPTFHRDVEPILQQRCQVCHRPEGVGPFPLLTYDDVAADLATIAEVVSDRRMPPWHADPHVGAFENSRALSDAERATLFAWIEAGGPRGDPAHAPPPREWPSTWALGEPDAVLETPTFQVPARGTVDYQYFRVPTDFGEDRWITGMEVRVDAPTVVHHVLVFVKYPREAGPSPQVRGGLEGYFASALPGDQAMTFPAGTARRLPRGSTLVFQVHYTPDGEARTDHTRLALYFARPGQRIEREARTVALYSTGFAIPPNVKGHEVRARYQFREDTMLHGFTPHMHLRGESFRYLLMYPDGTTRPMLVIPRYDFNWQTTYRLAEPVFVPKGARMLGLATYDNSADNPANPDPSRRVYFGEQTSDEMMIGYMDVIAATPAERAAWEQAGHGAVTPLGLDEGEE